MAALVGAASLLAGCGQPAAGSPSSGTPKAPPVSSAGSTTPSSPPPSPAPAAPSTFLIVMENHSYAQALAAPFTASLAAQGSLATNYHAVSHPSLPNYLALTSGSTWGIADDGYHVLPAGRDLGSQLTAAGLGWRAYMEGMTGGCKDSPYPYALKHNPFAYYGGRCPDQVVSLERLEPDLNGATPPRFAWVTPDLCHDGHDCTAAQADAFLKLLVGRITATAAWKPGALLVITWDEDDGSSGNQVALIQMAYPPRQQRLDSRFDHYSLLAMLEDRLGVARLGTAAEANAIPDAAITT